MAPEAPPLSSAELEAAPVAKESSSKDPSRDPVLDAASGDGAAKAPEPAPVKEGPEDVKLGEGEKKKKKRKKKSPGCGGKNVSFCFSMVYHLLALTLFTETFRVRGFVACLHTRVRD